MECGHQLDGFFHDIFNVLPKLLGFIFIQDYRGIVGHASQIDFDRRRIVPDLDFAMRHVIQIQCAISDSNEVNLPTPPASVKVA